MADEKAQVETPTQTEVTDVETPVTEDVQKPVDTTEKGSDYKQAMYEERDKRKALEQQLANPDFVYAKAKELGLTDAEAETYAEQASPVNAPPVNIPALVQNQLEIEKAKEKYPDLGTDEELGAMVTALINRGLSPLKAADSVMSRMGKLKEDAMAEGAKAKEQQLSDKEKAQTISGGTQVTDDMDEVSQLQKTIRGDDPRASQKARIELIKIRNKQAGVF